MSTSGGTHARIGKRRRGWLLNRRPGFFATLSTIYLGLMIVALLARGFGWFGIEQLPNRIGGIIPLAIPWFGALGAILISLYGVFDHNGEGRREKDPWDHSYDYWHVLRPLVGAVLGTVSYLIFVGFINATSATGTNRQSPIPTNAEDAIPYIVISFVVGFREDTFRQLIKRVIDTILGPGIPGVTPSLAVSFSPASVDFGEVKIGTKSDVTVHVSNTGAGNVVVHRRGDKPPGVEVTPDPFTVSDDTVSEAVIPPNSEATLTVTFTPTTTDEVTGTLSLNSNAGSRTIPLKGTGVPA